jgi:hypothetical protein
MESHRGTEAHFPARGRAGVNCMRRRAVRCGLSVTRRKQAPPARGYRKEVPIGGCRDLQACPGLIYIASRRTGGGRRTRLRRKQDILCREEACAAAASLKKLVRRDDDAVGCRVRLAGARLVVLR